MSFLVLPPELKLKIFEMVGAQDRAYRARVERRDRVGEYGRGLQALSVLSGEMRELAAPMLLSALSAAKAVQHVKLDVDGDDYENLVQSLAGPLPSDDDDDAEWDAYQDREREVETKGVWDFAEQIAPGFLRRLAEIPEWTFRGNGVAEWLKMVRPGVQATARTLRLIDDSGNLISRPDDLASTVTDFKALQSLILVDEKSRDKYRSSSSPAIGRAWLDWPHSVPPLTSLTLDVHHADTSVLAFISQFSRTLESLHNTGPHDPSVEPSTAKLADFHSFERLSLLHLTLPTIHSHDAVLHALQPHLPVLVSLTCTATVADRGVDTANSSFPDLFSLVSLPSLRQLRLDTAGEALQTSSWPLSLLSTLRSALSTRPRPVVLKTGWSPVWVDTQDPVEELRGTKGLLEWALRRVERAEEVQDEREMRLLLEGLRKVGVARQLWED
ncbi:hypothetical protein JCM10213_004134 [Rhodosporidiobolus nylandii]